MNDRSALRPDIAARLADFAAGFTWQAAPDEARAVLQLSLLDFAAVALAGADEPVARICREMVLAEGGRPEATVIGAQVGSACRPAAGVGARVPARAAALTNGVTAHALDYDDTHFRHIGHLAVVIFPATLAVAERTGAEGRAFLEAALVGYEAAAAIGAWLGRSHYEAGFHQTATAGALAAALAAARLMGLDAAAMVHALGLAATRAAGLKAAFGSMAKPYNAGQAAAAGVEAALLAARGLAASPALFADFAATHAGAAEVAPVAALGRDYSLPALSHKFHACCHGTHAAIEALGECLLPPVAPDMVERVEIAVHPRWLSVCALKAPRSGLEARFSLAMVTAMRIAGLDTGALASFSDTACRDPLLTDLRERVRVEGDASLADTAARVRVRLVSGETRRAAHDLAVPVPLGDRAARIRAKAEGLLGPARAGALDQAIGALVGSEQADSLAVLARLLGTVAGPGG